MRMGTHIEETNDALIPADVAELLFELFSHFDINIWRGISIDSRLARAWTSLVDAICVDGKNHDEELKRGLERYLNAFPILKDVTRRVSSL